MIILIITIIIKIAAGGDCRVKYQEGEMINIYDY